MKVGLWQAYILVGLLKRLGSAISWNLRGIFSQLTFCMLCANWWCRVLGSNRVTSACPTTSTLVPLARSPMPPKKSGYYTLTVYYLTRPSHIILYITLCTPDFTKMQLIICAFTVGHGMESNDIMAQGLAVTWYCSYPNEKFWKATAWKNLSSSQVHANLFPHAPHQKWEKGVRPYRHQSLLFRKKIIV